MADDKEDRLRQLAETLISATTLKRIYWRSVNGAPCATFSGCTISIKPVREPMDRHPSYHLEVRDPERYTVGALVAFYGDDLYRLLQELHGKASKSMGEWSDGDTLGMVISEVAKGMGESNG